MRIGEEPLLELLGEECSELTHAALKMARVKRGENPTPVTEDKAKENLIEEIADVYLVLDEIFTNHVCGLCYKDIYDIMDIKNSRWSIRCLNENNNNK